MSPPGSSLRHLHKRFVAAGWLLVAWTQVTSGWAQDTVIHGLKLDKAAAVQRELLSAHALFVMERYGLAFRRYEQVIALDPHNAEAHAGEECIQGALERLDLVDRWIELHLSTDASAPIYRKLKSLVFPEINFHNTPLVEALEFLHQESVHLDPDPEPNTRGVNIVLDPDRVSQAEVLDRLYESIPGLPKDEAAPEPVPAPQQRAASIRITLQMNQVPLKDLVGYVATQIGKKITVSDDGIHLKTPHGWDDEPTVEFDLTPEVLGIEIPNVGTQSNLTFIDAVIIHHANPRSWFEAHGVDFPPGANAVYQSDTHKLIVRTVNSSLAQIASLVDQ